MNAREERFCEEYLIDLNATAAAIRAGYKPSTAESAYEWLKEGNDREKPGLRARIAKLMAERSRRTGVNVDRVVLELARLGFVRITEVADGDARLLENIDPDDCAAIASIRVKKGDDFVEREVRMHDKLKALDLLGKHLGMYTDNVNVNLAAMPKIVANPDGGVE